MRIFMWLGVAALALACTEDNESSNTPEDAGVELDGATDDADATGAGGEGGMGGEIADGSPDGAGGMGGEGGGNGACVQACARFSDCAIEICSAYEDDDGESLATLCVDACEENASFVAVANGIATCTDLVAFGRQTLDSSFDANCALDPANLPHNDECDSFGERIATCAIEQCEGAAGTQEIMEAAYVHVCDEQVAQGALNPADIPAFAGPNTPCDAMVLSNIVDEQVRVFADLCENGPTPSIETCVEACEIVGPCIPVDADNAILRNVDRCAQICFGVSNPAERSWTCAAEGGTCAEVTACFGGQDVVEVPECVGYADRLAGCLVEDCAGLAEVDGVSPTMADVCDQQVAEGNLSVEQVSGVDGETACDDARLAAIIAFFLVDTPDNEDGPLAPICEGGPANPTDVCAAACEVAGPCIPEGSEGAALRDFAACTYFCGTNSDLPLETWQCFADLESCDGLAACVGEQ